MTRASWLVWGISVFAASGCGGTTLALDDFALARARALCERQARCCFDSPDVDFDVENCAQTAADGYRRWLQQLRADYDARAADGCVSAYRASCSEVEDVVQEACAHVFTGQQGLRAECTTDEECAPANGQITRCQFTVEDDFTHMVSRTWAECIADDHATGNFVPAQLGDACDALCVFWNGETHCSGVLAKQGLTPACFEAQGLTCADGHCQHLPTAGEPCLLNSCDHRNSYCDAMDRCTLYESEGEPCRGGDCGFEQYCSSASSTCERLRELGEACDDPAQCRSGACSVHCVEARLQLCDQGLPSAQ